MNQQEMIRLLQQMNAEQTTQPQFDLSQDVGSIEPIQSTPAQERVQGLANLLQNLGQKDLPLFGTFKDPRRAYQLADKLTFVDPTKQGGIGEFLPGFSYALAKKRQDPMGAALALLDLLPGGPLIGNITRKGLTRAQSDLFTGDVVKDAQRMHERAVRLGPEFNQEIDTVAESLGFRTTLPGQTKTIDDLTGFAIGTVKMPKRILEKAETKTGSDVTNITDPIRTRIIVKTPEEEERAAKAIKNKYLTFDKGRDVKPEGFVDRKLNIQFTGANGETLIGEVGLITEPMWRASNKNHPLYEEFRSMFPKGMPDDPKELGKIGRSQREKGETLLQKMDEIFAEAKKEIDPSFYD